jgi:hypothetical protein
LKNYLSLILIVIVFASCSTQKQVSQKKDEIKNIPTIENKVSLQAKLQIDYENFSYDGTIRIREDSLVWISLGKFGFEGVRILIKPDSLFLVNKLSSTYIAESIEKLTILDPQINSLISSIIEKSQKKSAFFIFQDIFLGKLDNNIIDENSFPNIVYSPFIKYEDNFLPQEITISLSQNNKITINIKNYKTLINFLAPFSIPSKFKKANLN